MSKTSSIDEGEVAKFEAMAAEWWDRSGKFAPLHAMNPTRLDYISRQITAEFGRDPTAAAPLESLRILDVGCGGGLVCEPMARLGANVTGIDAATESIGIARLHAEKQDLPINYRNIPAEELLEEGVAFDAVLALEIVEHVADPKSFLTTCAQLLCPGGILIASTLNKTAKAWALAVFGAERVLRWLPPGTHDWNKFIPPAALDGLFTEAGLEPVDSKGMVFDPLSGRWSLSEKDLSINYIAAAVRPAA